MADDTRVVQMQFDNRNFERNISRSQSSLEKFKKALNFEATAKGLTQFGNNLKDLAFDKLSDNIQRLTDKFTGLGDAGEYVLSRIRASLEGVALKAEQFVKNLTTEQVHVGQDKYDSLTKSVQTITAGGEVTEEKAYSVMERVMEYTNQTSHNFQTMVGEISSLTATGMNLDKAEKLMEGFANASTKAGADASKAAIAMSIYTKAIGAGYLGLQQFQSLQGTARVVNKEWREKIIEAALATGALEKDTNGVIRTAKKFGKQVEVTADNLESTLNKKWLNKETLKYFGEFYQFGETVEELKHPESAADSFGKAAYLTGQRALTFADGLNAVKEAISGGWMTTFRILFGDLTDAMNLWTGVCNKVIDAISGLSEARNAILKAWKGLGGQTSLMSLIWGEIEDAEGNAMYEGAYGIVDMFTDIGNLISGAFWDTFMNLIPRDQQKRILDEVNSQYKELGLDKPFESFQELVNSDFFIESGGREQFFGGFLMGVTEEIQNFVQSINDWFNEIDPESGLSRLDKIRIILGAIGRTIAFVMEIGGGIIHFFETLTGDDYLGPTLKAISDLLVKLGIVVVDTENDVSNSNGINTFFDNLAAVLQPVCEIINMVVGSFVDLINAMVDGEGENHTFGQTFTAIGDAIKKVITFITNLIRPVATFVSEVVGIIGDLFRDGFTDENVGKAKEKFLAAFLKMWEGIKTVLRPLLEAAWEFIKTVWEEIKSKIVAYFADENSIGHKILTTLKNVFGPVWEFLKGAWGTIKNIFGSFDPSTFQGLTLIDSLKILFASEGIQKLVRKLKELAKNGGLYKLLMGALGVVSVMQIIKTVKAIREFFEGIGDKLFNTDVNINVESMSEKFLKIAEAIALMAASVLVLGSMKIESVLQGIVALGLIMAEFAIFFKVLNAQQASWAQQLTIIGVVAAMAAAIGLLVIAMIPFMIADWSAMLRAVAGLGIVLTELIVFMELMKVLGLSTQGLNFKGIGKFAIAIGILMLSLIPFMIGDWQTMLRAVAGLGIVLLELIGFMELMKVLGLSTLGLNFKGIAKFAIAIAILMLSLLPFMIGDWQSMLRAVAGLGLVLLELIGFMELMKVLGLSTLGLNFKGLAKFAIAIAILMLSLLPFMIGDWQSMLRAVAGLGIVLLELIGFMELMKVLGLSTLGLNFKGLTKFVVAIGILMLALLPFILTDWSGMLRAVAGLGIVLLELIGFMELMKVLGLSTHGLDFTGFTGFVIAIGILMLALIPFISTDWEGMLRAVLGLGIILAEMIGFMELMKVLGLSTKGLDFAGILAFTASIYILVAAIKPFANMTWDEFTRAMAGMTAVFAELLMFMTIISAIPTDASKIGLVIAICLSIGIMALLLSVAMNEVRNIKWEVMAAFTLGMSVMLIAMAGAIAILAAIPMGAGLKGIALISAGLLAFAGVIAVVIPLLMNAIGNGLSSVGGKLELFASLMKGFSDKMGQVDDKSVDKAESALDKIKRVLNKLTGWGKFVGDLDNFSYSMFALGTGMEIFNNHVGNVASDIDGNAGAALKFIQDLSACANDLDTISKMKFEDLATAIAGLGGAMSLYGYGAQQIQGTLTDGEAPDEKTVSASIEIMKSISRGLIEAGGFDIPDDLPDDKRLTQFGIQLAALAGALVQFEQAGSQLGEGTAKALSCLDFFVDLKAKLIAEDFIQGLGKAIGVFDENDVNKDKLVEFGTNIEQLGLALAQFYTSTTELDKTTGERKALDFSDAVTTLDSLIELQGKLGWEFGPLIQFFAGRSRDFNDLGAQIETLSTALADFNEKLNGVDEQGNPKLDTKLFESAISVCDMLVDYLNELKEKMGKVGGTWGVIGTFFAGRDYDFTDLKKQLEALAEGLSSLGNVKVESKLLSVDETSGIFATLDLIFAYMDKMAEKMGKVGGVWNTIDQAINGHDYNFTDLRVQLIALGEGLKGISGIQIEDIPSAEEMAAAFPTIDALIDYMNTLGEKVDENDGHVGGVYNIVNTALNGRKYNFEDLSKQLIAIGTGLKGISEVNIDPDGKTIFNKDGTGAAIETIDALLMYMTTLGEKVGKVGGVAKFFTEAWEGKDADFQFVGTQIGYLGDGLGKFQQGINAAGNFNAETVNSALGAVENLIGMLRTFVYIEDKMRTVSNSMDIRNYTIQSFMQDMSNMLYWMYNAVPDAQGGTIVQKLAEFVVEFDNEMAELGGLKNKESIDVLNDLSEAIVNLVDASRNARLDDGTFVDFNFIGTAICDGVIKGIQAGQAGVVTAAAEMAVAAYEEAKKRLSIESPSKKFAWLGENVGKGFVKGISSENSEVKSAADLMTETAINGTTDAMALFASLMSQEIDANPTITPVLDLSNVTAGSAAIDDLLSKTKELNLSGAGGDYSSRYIPNSDNGTVDYRGQDISWIRESISELGERIESMGNKISHMQVVMNTGALVGQVTDGVNRNLGAKTIYGRRRN